MASSINSSIRLPIAYILTNGSDTKLLASMMKKSLEEMNKCGGQVITISLDGLRANFSAAKQMGANFDLQNEDFKTYILHPTTGIKVYIFPDPSHMLKLARNALEAYGSFVDEDGKEIKWEYFKNLARLQKEEGLRAGNKLTTRHTDFSKQKMKVKLAVQVLSSSVSTALTVCEKIGLPQFQGSSATSKFAKIMDRIYDALNSHAGGKGFKSPLASWNKHIWKKNFSDATAYLMNLKRKSDNTLLYKTKRSTFVIGLIVCMKSLESVQRSIVNSMCK